jgi:D-serine dehydratase
MSAAIEDMVIDDGYKGYPNGIAPSRLGDIGRRGWSVLRQDVPLPAAVLLESALDNNSAWMRRFLELTGARICPHGKTTMSPQLFRRQLADGAWGITVATVDQLRICRAHGIARIVMANQLVERQGIRYVLDELARDPPFDFYCLVDSVEGVRLLAEAARKRGLERPLQVLLEAGFPGGRTGCRSEPQAVAVAEAVRTAAPLLALRGVEGFEGLIHGATTEETQAKVEAFLGFMTRLLRLGIERGWFAEGPVLITAGGSAFFDLAAEGFAQHAAGREVIVVLRSGCYLTHDSKSYERMFDDILARSASAREAGGRLKAALQVWGAVQSTPEPGLALATMGKRDAGFDVDLPVPLLWHRPGMNRPAPLPEGHVVTGMNDQHAYVRLPPDSPLRFGDLVGFGVSHPCTTFDRWQLIYTVDDTYEITGAIRTFF